MNTSVEAAEAFMNLFDNTPHLVHRLSRHEKNDAIYNPDPVANQFWLPVNNKVPEKNRGEVIGKWSNAVLIVWFSPDMVLIILGSLLQVPRISANKLKKLHPTKIVSKTQIPDKMRELYSTVPENALVPGPVVHPEAPTDFLRSNAVESLAQQIIFRYLSAQHYCLTNEGCFADGCYCPFMTEQVLGIQVKASRKVSTNGHFHFCMVKRYEGLLVIAIALTLDLVIVAPGACLPKNSLGGSPTGIWSKYIVQKDQLSLLLNDVYRRVARGVKEVRWPSGAMISVDSMQLRPKAEMMIPSGLTQQKEHKYVMLRQGRLPNLVYEKPHVENGPVDYIIEEVDTQDKLAHKIGSAFTASLHRATSDRRYHIGDFSALYIHIDDLRFYLIPATALVKNGILHQDPDKTKSSITVYPDGGSANSPTWSNTYLLSYDTPNIEDIVKARYQEIHRTLTA